MANRWADGWHTFPLPGYLKQYYIQDGKFIKATYENTEKNESGYVYPFKQHKFGNTLAIGKIRANSLNLRKVMWCTIPDDKLEDFGITE